MHRNKLPPLPTKPRSGNAYSLPTFGFAPSKTNLFKIKKKTRSLFPFSYRTTDPLGGYIGFLASKDPVTHATFPRFAPRKLYTNTADTLLPRQLPHGRRRLIKLNPSHTRKNNITKIKKKRTNSKKTHKFCNPFHLHNPSPETIFLVAHEKHGKRPPLARFSP